MIYLCSTTQLRWELTWFPKRTDGWRTGYVMDGRKCAQKPSLKDTCSNVAFLLVRRSLIKKLETTPKPKESPIFELILRVPLNSHSAYEMKFSPAFFFFSKMLKSMTLWLVIFEFGLRKSAYEFFFFFSSFKVDQFDIYAVSRCSDDRYNRIFHHFIIWSTRPLILSWFSFCTNI